MKDNLVIQIWSQSAIYICTFCICRFNQLLMENIQKKCYTVADMHCVVRPTMTASVLNVYRHCLYSLNNTA